MMDEELDAIIAALEERFEIACDETRSQLHQDVNALIASHRSAGKPVPPQLLALEHQMVEAEVVEAFDNMPV